MEMSESDSGQESPFVDSRPNMLIRHPQLIDDDKNTQLHYAAAQNDVNGVINYLENDSSKYVDPENYLGWTPLMMACRNGHFSIVKILLSYRANATKKNYLGMNVFQIAIASGNLELVKFLLDHFLIGGISKRILENSFSAISIAILFRHQNVLEYLINKRFQLDMQTKITGVTPLMFAQAMENDPAISTLLQKNVDTKIKNSLGHTAIDIATIRQQMKMINTNDHKLLAQKLSPAVREQEKNELQNQQLRSILQLNKPNSRPSVVPHLYTSNHQVPYFILSPCANSPNVSYLQVTGQMLPGVRKSSNVSPREIPPAPNVTPITPVTMGSVQGQVFFPPNFSPCQVPMSHVYSSVTQQSQDLLNTRFNSSAGMFLSPSMVNFMSPCM